MPPGLYLYKFEPTCSLGGLLFSSYAQDLGVLLYLVGRHVHACVWIIRLDAVLGVSAKLPIIQGALLLVLRVAFIRANILVWVRCVHVKWAEVLAVSPSVPTLCSCLWSDDGGWVS